MPLIRKNQKSVPYFVSNRHFQTLYPNYFRWVPGVTYERERIDTPDQDFLDLDWSRTDSDILVILSHGLEGHSNRPYVRGMVKVLNRGGLDCLAWNYRSCGGEINLQPRYYHGGVSDDLEAVVLHACSKKKYKKIILLGFSLGASITLNYLGKDSHELPAEIGGGICISAPCDLYNSIEMLHKHSNRIYMNFFLREYKEKVKAKAKKFPEIFKLEGIEKIKNLWEFDEKYNCPLYGYKDPKHFYSDTSSLQHIPNITIPTLILNATDDPFLGKKCYPVKESRENKFVELEVVKKGGHVGFFLMGTYYSELRSLEWINNTLERSI